MATMRIQSIFFGLTIITSWSGSKSYNLNPNKPLSTWQLIKYKIDHKSIEQTDLNNLLDQMNVYKYGIKDNHPSKFHKTPEILEAFHNANPIQLERLLSWDSYLLDPLAHYCAFYAQTAKVEYLVLEGADPNSVAIGAISGLRHEEFKILYYKGVNQISCGIASYSSEFIQPKTTSRLSNYCHENRLNIIKEISNHHLFKKELVYNVMCTGIFYSLRGKNNLQKFQVKCFLDGLAFNEMKYALEQIVDPARSLKDSLEEIMIKNYWAKEVEGFQDFFETHMGYKNLNLFLNQDCKHVIKMALDKVFKTSAYCLKNKEKKEQYPNLEEIGTDLTGNNFITNNDDESNYLQ